MNVVVPTYMKNILKFCGYDNCHSIATIADADVDYCTDEVRKGRVNSFYDGKISAEAVMEGCTCTAAVENFVFSRGHVRLLQAIVKIVKNTLEIHGVDSFLLKLPKVSPKEREHLNLKAAPVYRKRFKFSEVTSISTQDNNEVTEGLSSDDANSCMRKARNTLIRKAITTLITHSPNLFANVSKFLFFKRMNYKGVVFF